LAIPSPADTAARRATTAATIAAVVVGLTVEGVVRKGAFHNTDALVVAVASAGLIVARVVVGIERRNLAVLVPLLALTLWWLASAARHGAPESFLPLGASMLGFGAGFLATASLDAAHRKAAAAAMLGIGAVSAGAGLVAEAFRLFPVAARAQDLWRLSTTLTYANAAGLLLAMALLFGLGLDQRNGWVRLAIFLCVAGLVTTQSRGAVLACLLAATLVPWSQLRSGWISLVVGILVGLVAVATSSGNGARPAVVIAAAVGCIVVVLPGLSSWRRLSWHQMVTVQAVLLLVTVAALVFTSLAAAQHGHLSRRLDQDRTPEWRAAVDQWQSSPALGVGPDKPLVLDPLTDTTTDYAHDEYLQVLAGGGLVGAALLVAVGVGLASLSRRHDVISSCAVAALVAFAVAGALDYDWHLPALGLVGGWAAGLVAAFPSRETVED
jgi:hypothetical protein